MPQKTLIDTTILRKQGRRGLALVILVVGVWFSVKFVAGIPLFARDVGHWSMPSGHSRLVTRSALGLAIAYFFLYGLTACFCFYVAFRMFFPRIVSGVIASIEGLGAIKGQPFFKLRVSHKTYSIRTSKVVGFDPQSWTGKDVRLGVGAFPFCSTYFIEVET